jgi:hypothetical protein
MRFAQVAIPAAVLTLCLCLVNVEPSTSAPSEQRSKKTKLTPASTPAPSPTPNSTPSAGVAGPSISKPRSEYHLPLGQTLVYGAVWRVFNAGTATLRVEQVGPEVRVVGTADATGAAALLYHVRDRYESFLNPGTFCSRSVFKHTEEGLRRVETSLIFDYSRNQAVLEQKNLAKKEGKHTEHQVGGCVTDVLSALYYAGSLPLETGSTYQFPINDGGETLTVNLHVEAREQLKTPAGTFNTIRVQPETPAGLLKDKGKIWIWYSEDAARIPVQARAHMYWGTLTFTLQRVAAIEKLVIHYSAPLQPIENMEKVGP